MSISAATSGGFSFSLRSSSNSVSSTSADSIKQQLTTKSTSFASTSSSASNNSAQLKAKNDQVRPKGVTKDDLEHLKDTITQNGGDGSKIDQLISSFDEYDTNKTGSISFDTLKSYADQNGISLPEHKHSRPAPSALLPGASAFASTDDTTKTASKAAVSGFLSKYAGTAAATSTTATDTTASPTEVSTTTTTSSSSTSTSSTSGSTDDVSQQSSDELKAKAAAGDVEAQKELDRRATEKGKKASEESKAPAATPPSNDDTKVDDSSEQKAS